MPRASLCRLFVALVALLVTACQRRDSDPLAQPVARVRQALTVNEVMGLEDPAGWSTTTAGAVLTQSTDHTQGSFSLQLAPSSTNGFAPIKSVPLTKPDVIGPRMAFDIKLPTQQANPFWFGTVQIYVDCPSRGIFSAFLAQVELTGKPLGVFLTVDFPVQNSTIGPLLNPGYTDLRFTLVVNVQVPTTGVYRLDNLRFLPAPANGCGGRPNGTFCDDANACTTGDSCQGGVCTGTAVTCTTDQCHTVGACVPASGCPAPVAKANGTACNDGDACTTGDHCTAGACGGQAKTCESPDACHVAGTCDPATGECSDPVSRPTSTTTVSGFDYDGAGRQIRDGDADLVYDNYDRLRDVRPRTTSAPKFNDGKPVVAEHHSYCYDGTRSSTTTSPGTPNAATEYRFSSDYVERDGRRDHYVRVGDRLIARVSTVAPAQGATAAPGPAEIERPTDPAADRRASGRNRWLLEVALLVLLASVGGFFGRELVRRRRAPFRTLVRVAALPIVFCMACESLRSARSNEPLAWDVVETLFFHQGIAAGPVLITDSNGAVVEERRYEPFGQPIDARQGSEPPGDVDFVREAQNILNKQTDVATGWSDHGARWMAPQSARWISPDPAVKGPSAAGVMAPWELNPYQYASQSPSAFWDPDGQKGRALRAPRAKIQVGAPLVWQVQRMPDAIGRHAPENDFPLRLVVQGVPKDVRWEHFVKGSITIHTLTKDHIIPAREMLPDEVRASSRPFGNWMDDLTKGMTPGPREVDPEKYANATYDNGTFTLIDSPGYSGRFMDTHQKGGSITGVTFNLKFETKLWRPGATKPFLKIQFSVTGSRKQFGGDSRKVQLDFDRSGSFVEPSE